MNVVYYSSDFFSEMCAISILSLCEKNRNTETINIFIVEDGITEKNKKRLLKITDRFNRNLEFIHMPTQDEIYPGVKVNLGRTYTRMALAEILPEKVERVLSLDSDTLILDSLKNMYNIKFKKNEYVAGVYDCVGKSIQKGVLHAPDDIKYCNAGMFLIDLKKWRHENVGRQLLEMVLEKADGKHTMYFLEQDLMNLVFHGHLRLLHPRYNMLTSLSLFDYKEVIKMKKPVSYYSCEILAEAKEKPVLIHATTCFYVQKRMWVEGSDHPYAKQYQQYRLQTDWAKEPLIQDNRTFTKKIYSSFWHLMPRGVAINLASFMINYVRPAYARVTSKLNVSTIAKQSAT